ncbi:MAG: ferrous iron transport protein A [Firmicutes bacterium]|nr:ferrous iron transport protein A [Bacillota bacterium]
MKNGIISDTRKMRLYDARKNSCCKVVSSPDHPLLDSLGICPDSLVVVKNKYAFGGPVLLQVDTATIALGKLIAQQILVEEVAG